MKKLTFAHFLLPFLAALPVSLLCGRALAEGSGSMMEKVIGNYLADHGSISRTYPHIASEAHRARRVAFLLEERQALDSLMRQISDGDDMVDFILFRNHLDGELEQIVQRKKKLAEISSLIPFGSDIVLLDEERRAFRKVQPERAAKILNDMASEIEELRLLLSGDSEKKKGKSHSPVLAHRASQVSRQLNETLKEWYEFYSGYDPLFTWWVQAPYNHLQKVLREYGEFLRVDLGGIEKSNRDAIVGDPIGREALLAELKREMIVYSPEELVQIAEKEYAWCEAEMKRASREMGFGDEWLKAVEHVKTLHRPPGEQPELIRELALEAVDFLEARDLLTVPPLAKESWRMEMMSAERQKVSPFFTGGEVISVAFPLDSMQHEQKMMSLRGNNVHFSRATVHHELIPGHHLQGFMMDRHRPYRQLFWTPFWLEGWALYWEMQLWDLGFPKSPEDRVGMLFWRMHRCARIVFSLNFHLGKMSPQECIDLLVNRVGHELDNATAEVRRSFAGDYPPLYQAAYMVGALQFRALYQELVVDGGLGAKEFHDGILTGNIMPVEMVRVLLARQRINADFSPNWRFYERIER